MFCMLALNLCRLTNAPLAQTNMVLIIGLKQETHSSRTANTASKNTFPYVEQYLQVEDWFITQWSKANTWDRLTLKTLSMGLQQGCLDKNGESSWTMLPFTNRLGRERFWTILKETLCQPSTILFLDLILMASRSFGGTPNRGIGKPLMDTKSMAEIGTSSRLSEKP